MNWIFYEDRLIRGNDLFITSTNRSFRYGDGLFETILVSCRHPLYLKLHLTRLFKGMKLMGIEIPDNWNGDYFKNIINELAIQNNYEHARCRITVWREGAGYYAPHSNHPGILIELNMHETSTYELTTEGISMGIFEEYPKLMHPLSACKTANCLVYVLAAIYAHEQSLGDAVILNQEGRIADTINSNLFIYRDKKLYTPAIEEGGVDGVMRHLVISICRKEVIEVNEIKMQLEDLNDADEVFLTNVISGIKWIGNYKTKTFNNQFSKDLIYILNEEQSNDTLVPA